MLVLASSSPRRRQLLEEWGYRFQLVESPVSEELPAGIPPEEGVQELARHKARSGFESWTRIFPKAMDTVLGADTIVVLGDRILGKPADEEEAAEMLAALSGRTHRVMTGIALAFKEDEEDKSCRIDTGVEITTVVFREITRQEIEDYIATGEPMDKAAAYGIQGEAGKFVSRVEGSLTNVIGLPMELLAEKLKARGIFPQ